jgi:AcrR family transcriptional regulator
MAHDSALPSARPDVRLSLLDAADSCLQGTGYSGFSTRRVAEAAGAPLSQIHYHFGSKQGLMLALLEHKNAQLLQRQAAMFGTGEPLWRRWEQACDYLEQDLGSGYVRILQEMIALGWSEPAVAAAVRRFLAGWYELVTRMTQEAADRFGGLGPFTAAEAAGLIGHAFLGCEAMLLIDFEATGVPVRACLRKFGTLVREAEERDAAGD